MILAVSALIVNIISPDTPSPTPSPRASSLVTPKPLGTSAPQIENTKVLKYPNSVQISQNESTIYESSDDADKITNWYKDKIKSMNMRVKSFVTTKTNGNILNKLVGADGKKEIKVEITKKDDDQKVTITVDFRAG